MYFVYILKCADGTLYTGSTNDLEKRVERHQRGQGGRYTRSKSGVALAYSEEHPDRSSALKREAEIKRWTRKKKLDLIGDRG